MTTTPEPQHSGQEPPGRPGAEPPGDQAAPGARGPERSADQPPGASTGTPPEAPSQSPSAASPEPPAGEAAGAPGPAAVPPERRAVTAGTSPALVRAKRTSAGPSPHVPSGADRRGVIMGALTAGAAVVAGGALAVRGGSGGPGGSGGTGGGQVPATGETVELAVTIKGMRFIPDTVEVDPGDRLIITVDNPSEHVHDLVLETGATTGRIAAGATGTLDAGIITGPTEGWCSIAGHRAQGMVFHITAAGAAGGTSATPEAHDGADHSGHSDHSGHAGHSSSGQAAVPDYEAPLPEGFTAFNASLPPAPSNEQGPVAHQHTFTVTERVMEVGAGATQRRMTFNGQVPGPVLRGSVGDTFEITLVNEGTMSHSLDFHAGVTPPDEAMRSINPGESLVYRFTAQRSGIWLYHCSTAPMSLHLAAGMHGAVVIDPPGLSPVDKEFIIVASEVYLGDEGGDPDFHKIAAKTPDLMTFNGVAFQYAQQPLEARVGERLRFWVMAAGPSLLTSFHIVGLQFDQVFFEGAWTLGGPARIGQEWSGGSQALGLHPAQGGFVECQAQEPGHYVFVTHAFGDMEKGAKGILRITA